VGVGVGVGEGGGLRGPLQTVCAVPHVWEPLQPHMFT